MEAVVEREYGKETSWFLDALGEVGGFAIRLAKNFFRLILICGVAVLLVALVVYVAGNDGVISKGLLGSGLVLIAGGIAAFMLAVKLSVVFSVSDTVKTKNVGRKILDALFSVLLGVTKDKPQCDYELTQKLHGISMPELETRLKRAGNVILEHRITTAAVPAIIRWLMNKTQQLLVWGTIRVVVAYATANKSRDDKVDLLALRANLAVTVDNLLARQIAQGTLRFALFVLFLLVLGSWGLVEVLHRVPWHQIVGDEVTSLP